MKLSRHKVIAPILVIILAFGVATKSAARSESCAPKACCCSVVRAQEPHHDGHALIPPQHDCTPPTPAHCCHLKTVQPKMDLAISSIPTFSADHEAVTLVAFDNKIPAPQQFATKPSILADERIRAPLVPIYLLTLTIRC